MKRLWQTLSMVGLGWAWLKYTSAQTSPNQGLKKWVLVTGASSGIGQAIATQLENEGFKVLGTVRQAKDAEMLKEKGITPLLLDLENITPKAIDTLKKVLDGQALYGLVNNAGIAVTGPVALLDLKALRQQFEINVFGLTALTQTLLPLMDQQGKIIQMSSITGVTTQPLIGAYSASKHALEAISTALRRELKLIDSKVEVIVIQPGSIETPIWNKLDQTVNLKQYENTPYEGLSKRLWQRIQNSDGGRAKAEDVALTVLKILRRKKNAPYYIVSNNWPEEVIVPRLLPDRTLDWVFSKILR